MALLKDGMCFKTFSMIIFISFLSEGAHAIDTYMLLLFLIIYLAHTSSSQACLELLVFFVVIKIKPFFIIHTCR